MAEQKYYFSEIFYSIQGEGTYTGVPCAWLRFFLCNLQCNGFGQKDPTDPSTYELPYENFDVSSVKRVEDLPVWDKGCDSSYTWAKKFKPLMGQATGKELAEKLRDILRNESNPEGYFMHPVSYQHQHLCITGGEPLMRHAQKAFVELYEELKNQNGGPYYELNQNSGSNIPASVTFETNGTQPLTNDFANYLANAGVMRSEIFFSISPKLWTVAGEKKSKAIKIDTIKQYFDTSRAGQLKFVVGNDDRQWEEMEDTVSDIRKAGVRYPVWIMPVSATAEDQLATAGGVAERAFRRGYNVAARVHCYLFGNQIGT
jgi:6-pyruvoyltetrahydropterin 2'-reductase